MSETLNFDKGKIELERILNYEEHYGTNKRYIEKRVEAIQKDIEQTIYYLTTNMPFTDLTSCQGLEELRMNLTTRGLPPKLLKDYLTFQSKQERMDCLLNYYEKMFKDEGFALIKTSEPYFLGRGEHQAVINLGNNLVAKIGYTKRGLKKYNETPENPTNIVISRGFPLIKTTHGIIEKSGLPIPKMELYRLQWGTNGLSVVPDVINCATWDEWIKGKKDALIDIKFPKICITEDLRNNGQYIIKEATTEIINEVKNKEELTKEYDELLKKLLQICKDKNFSFNQHSDFSLCSALKHTMFILISDDGVGKLVIGDFDHIQFWDSKNES